MACIDHAQQPVEPCSLVASMPSGEGNSICKRRDQMSRGCMGPPGLPSELEGRWTLLDILRMYGCGPGRMEPCNGVEAA
jgi:hypothetical protein